MLVRSWNLFHGNTKPPQRSAYLEEMVCASQRPTTRTWSACRRFRPGRSGGSARRPGCANATRWRPGRSLGPVPITRLAGRALTAPNHGLLRSAFAGQGNAILLRASLQVVAEETLVLNTRRFRTAQARWLRLDPIARLAWGKERRVCHALRLALSHERALVVANMHCTSYPPDQRIPDAELLRGAWFADTSRTQVMRSSSPATSTLRTPLADAARPVRPRVGFSAAGPAIDHILVRGARTPPVHRWPDARRERGGRLLSDHAPVEVELELT